MMSSGKIWDVAAEIVSIDKISENTFFGIFKAPAIARSAIPFQFVNVRVREGTQPLLRRPFSLSRIFPDDGEIGLTWAVVGQGTRFMCDLAPGDTVSMLGPLGNGFLPSGRDLLLIAGGTGLAPMYPLAEAARSQGLKVTLLYGARSSRLMWDTRAFRDIGCHVLLATEDGSQGITGTVLDILRECGRKPGNHGTATVLACGPKPMLSAVKSFFVEMSGEGCRLKRGTVYVSLEEHMGCGMGLCRGCAVRKAGESGDYFHVCTDGPVFDAADVDLSAGGQG